MSRPNKPSPTHPGRPTHTRRHPVDHRHRRSSDQRSSAPATVWAPPPTAVGPAWESWLHASIRAAFLPSAGRMLVLTEQALHPSPPAAVVERRERTQDAGTLNLAGEASHPTDLHPTDTDRVDDGADLVFVDLRDSHIDDHDGHHVDHHVEHRLADRVGMRGRRALRPGGILTVLTRCHIPRLAATVTPTAAIDTAAELIDPTGPIVASAQNADLLYLQHIVIPTAPLLPPENALTTTAVVPRRGDRGDGQPAMPSVRPALDDGHGHDKRSHDKRSHDKRGHEQSHVDLLVFLSPRSPALARPDLGSASERARGAR